MGEPSDATHKPSDARFMPWNVDTPTSFRTPRGPSTALETSAGVSGGVKHPVVDQ